MSGRGRGKQLTRPAWMQDPSQLPPSVSQRAYNATPVDWIQTHTGDGRPYWYSLSTGQTTWNDPTKANPLPADSPKARSPEWKQHRTDDGRIYYYNASTKQTQWNAPSDLPSATEMNRPATASAKSISQDATAVTDPKQSSLPCHALPDGWAEHRTQDGRIYYYHSATRETRWEKPIISPAQATQATQTRQAQPNSGIKRSSISLRSSEPPWASSNLPADWAESRTGDGKIYYYNKISRETSWTAPSAQSDLKRPRIAASVDLRNIVNRAREQKEGANRKPDVRKHVVRRPRSFAGKPLTDRQAENYFLQRRAKTKDSFPDLKNDDVVHRSDNVPSSLEHSEHVETKFREMLKDKGVTERTTWLEAMSRCAADDRYLLVGPYGRRKHAWMKFVQKLVKVRRRKDVLRRRQTVSGFYQLLNTTFANEPCNVLSLNRCSAESIRSLEADSRYKAVEGRERSVLIKSFFSARTRRGAIEHAKRRKEALETIRRALDEHIHPSLLAPRELLSSAEHNGCVERGHAVETKHAEHLALESPDCTGQGDKKLYFDEHTSTHEVELFIEKLPQSSDIDKNDITGLIRSWKRHLHAAVSEKRAREREDKLAQQRAYRAAFRNGIESMMLSGRLPINPRWKDVCELIGKESFARTEVELDARAVDLFEDGVRLFDERVQSHREEFKRLLKDESVNITDETTIEELQKSEGLAAFFKHIGNSIAAALLLDRQRKESKKKQKERDRALGEFENLIQGSDIPLGTSFEKALESWEEIPIYVQLQKFVGRDRLRKVYDEFMQWRKEKEEKRMKRKFEQNQGIPYDGTGIPTMENVKRARVSVRSSSMINHDAVRFSQVQQPEEENGWAAALSAKPVNESEKLKERERRKREILES